MIDRRYNRDGTNNIIFTSNKSPALWKNDFNEDDDLLCALDRIFDDATVFNIRGDSYRGKRLENIALKTTRVSASVSDEQSE
jgi:DNA replication protein DnaC